MLTPSFKAKFADGDTLFGLTHLLLAPESY